MLERIANSLEKPIEIPLKETQPDDEEAIFGKLVASKLRKMKNVRIRCEVVSKIHQALLDGELAHVEWSENPATSLLAMLQNSAPTK